MKRVILHHSLTKDGDVKNFDAIRRYHIETKGFTDIGYHYVIEMVNGEPRVFKGRSEHKQGAHTLGQNEDTIGVCIVGNYDVDMLPYELKFELDNLLYDLNVRYGRIQVEGHCDHSTKTCPGKLFPLGTYKAIWNHQHWADDLYVKYNENIGKMHEKRFDSPLTRAEYLALRVSEYEREGK